MWNSSKWEPTAMTRGVSGLIGMWGAVVAISLFAPDLVSGSQHEHLPVAAFTTWLWGLVATRSVVSALLRLDEAGSSDQLRGRLVGVVAAIWAVAALVAIFGPQMVTGSDPTHLPLAALLAPIAASALTTGACETAAAFAAAQRRSQGYPPAPRSAQREI